MKKALSVILAFSLILALSACGGKKAAFSPAKDAAQLRDTQGVFATGLTQIDQAAACALYGIDESTVTASAVFGSTSSAEELAIFTFSSQEEAQAAQTLLHELPKLEKAVIEVREDSVLLVVASDYGPVEDFLKG